MLSIPPCGIRQPRTGRGTTSQDTLADAIAEVGLARRGGQRLEETRELFAFVQQEMTQMMERWKQHPRTL